MIDRRVPLGIKWPLLENLLFNFAVKLKETNKKQAFIFFIHAKENLNVPLKCLNLSPKFGFHPIFAAKANIINQIVMAISVFLHFIFHTFFLHTAYSYTVYKA